jgi:multiple sugar transport system permease protein
VAERSSAWRRREERAAWFFLAPALGVLTLFFFLPIAAAWLLSFTDFDIYAVKDAGNARLVGLGNYGRLVADEVFWQALRNTFSFVLLGGPATVLLALLAAIALNSRLTRGREILRTLYFAPVVTTVVAVAAVWRYLYHPRFGLFNYLLALVGIGPIDWLQDPRWAMPALVLMAIWKNFGYNMVIFLAGLQNIPPTLYEAARLDGAGFWAQLRHITLPMLRPTLLFVAIITTIGYFQLFAEPYVMTDLGNPLNRTLSIVLLMYKQGYRWWNLGYAAAISFVLFLIILGASLLQARLQRSERSVRSDGKAAA